MAKLSSTSIYGDLYVDGTITGKVEGVLPLSGGVMTGIITTPNSSKGIQIGDDIYLCDRDVSNSLVLEGGQDSTLASIVFGSGKDTNIYRGGANLLKTDDTFNAVGGFQWNGQSLDSRYAPISHSQSAHAPSNAQKNSDITKAEIEAKLTGTVTSHNHSGTYAPASHNHTSLTDITSLTFGANSDDSSIIKITKDSTTSYTDFIMSDDAGSDMWRWRFKAWDSSASAATAEFNLMTLKATSTTKGQLSVNGNVTADSFTEGGTALSSKYAAASHGTHVSYGGNGSATTVSRSDHSHSYYSRSSVGDIGWGTTSNQGLPTTVAAIAYWNGAYQGTSSNLAYCSKGAFGTIVTKNAGDYAAASHGTHLTIGTGASNAAAGNHTHSYLPLSGGTMTGSVTLNNNVVVRSKTPAAYTNTSTSASVAAGSYMNLLQYNDSGNVHINSTAYDSYLNTGSTYINSPNNISLRTRNSGYHQFYVNDTAMVKFDSSANTFIKQIKANGGITLGSNMTISSGNINFAETTSTTYPAQSNKISWSGSTDGADIYYQVDASDKGRLVLNTRDDSDCVVAFANNGTIKSTIDNSGNFSGSSSKWGGYSIWVGTQAQYDAISSKSSTTVYLING